jgi:putative transposase
MILYFFLSEVRLLFKTYKVRLLPNNKQQTRLLQTAGAARFAYNWAIAYERQNYEAGGKFISDGDLRKVFTQLKKQEEYSWLNTVSNEALKQAIKDACRAYERFFKKLSDKPKFKMKHRSLPSFQGRQHSIEFTETHVKLEKISISRKFNHQKLNWVRLAEKIRIPLGVKYYNPRITFDGLHWWISVGVEEQESTEKPTNDGIGIDLGIKDLAICSDGNIYPNINKTPKVKKLTKKLKREQRNLSQKFQDNVDHYIKKGKGQAPVFKRSLSECKNYQKQKLEVLRLHQKLANIQQNYLQQTTSEIINRKPKFIVLEDLNVEGMKKNKHLSKAISEQKLAEFRRQITYKCEWSNIQLIVADRFFPSSKTCSCCGFVKKDLTLKDRVYSCSECGNVIDRDYQAALNLRNYGAKQMANIIKGEELLAG